MYYVRSSSVVNLVAAHATVYGSNNHRRSQGVQWVHLHPQGGEKKFSGLIYRKNVKVHPQPKQESIFRIVFAGFGGIFRQSLRATTKKGQLFWQKSAPPPRQNPGYTYGNNVAHTAVESFQFPNQERNQAQALSKASHGICTKLTIKFEVFPARSLIIT